MTRAPSSPSTEQPVPSGCRWFREHLDTFLDGELDPSLHAEFDRHLGGCLSCRDELAFRRSFQAQLRAAVAGARCPEHLRARIRAGLDEVDGGVGPSAVRRAGGKAAAFVDRPSTGWTRSLRAPLAATSVLAVAGMSVLAFSPGPDAGTRESASRERGATGRAEGRRDSLLPEVLQGAVELHRAALPADVRSNRPDHLERYVEPHVRFSAPPVRLDDAEPVGARLVTVQGRHVPAYYYRRLDGRRVTVLVVDAEGAAGGQSGPSGVLRAISRRVGGQPVQVLQRAGRTYVLTADLPERELARLAVQADVP
jgi:anti-sigma factor (TIGR02949 family)